MLSTVLFKPNLEHRSMLYEGTCGSRPPIRYLEVHNDQGHNKLKKSPDQWCVSDTAVVWNPEGAPSDADWAGLVIIWEGKVLCEGFDRLVRATNAALGRDRWGVHPSYEIDEAFERDLKEFLYDAEQFLGETIVIPT